MSESVDPIKFEVIRNTLTAATEEMLSESNIISFDMGGTTAKVGLILDGKPALTKEYEVGAAARAGTGSSRGTGYRSEARLCRHHDPARRPYRYR